MAQYAENMQRADLTPQEEKDFYLALQADLNMGIAEIARIVHKSRDYVRRRIEGQLTVLQPESSKGLLKKSRNVLIDTLRDEIHNISDAEKMNNISQSVAGVASPPGFKLHSKSSEQAPPYKAELQKFNPAAFAKFVQYMQATINLFSELQPDEKTREQIAQSLSEMEMQLSILKKKLGASPDKN